MRFILMRTIFPYLKLCILCIFACPVSIHPLVNSVLPFSNRLNINWCQGLGHILLECAESVIAMFSEIPLDCSPEIFNEIEFTMIFWEENAQMASLLNDFLNSWFLFLEIWLRLKEIPCTAICWPGATGTFGLALQMKTFFWPKSTFCEHKLDPLWLLVLGIRKHWLDHFLTILVIPTIPHWFGMFFARIKVHFWYEQSILRIGWVTLRVVDKEKSLISWAMQLLKSGYYFLLQLWQIRACLRT